MMPLQPQTAGLPSGTFGGRRRHAAVNPTRLLDAPHRLGFFAGGSLLALLALWWGGALVARAAGLVVPWEVTPTTAHALAFVFGFMPLFFVGFLFTAGPRWLGLPEVPARRLLLPVGLMVLGVAAALVGFHTSSAMAALGLAAVSVGFGLATGLFGLMVLESPAADRDHARLVLVGCGVIVAALWAAAVAVAIGHDAAARATAHGALWGGFGLVFATVAHRMIPFFTAAALPSMDAWKPRALLGLLALLVAVQAPFAVAEALLGGRVPAGVSALRAAIELPGGALLLWLALRWGLVQSLKLRLLAMLHMGFFWLGVAFTLGGVSHALMSLTEGQVSLGLAPLHAFTMGYLGSTLLAMATRVACGHSGRALVADNWAWAMFWALQAGIAARVAAALLPAGAGTPLTLFAAQCWLAAMGAWALRYGPWFLQRRVDGRAG
ncbi:NnrS family protein [Ideonella sp. A 288]|uniref:NnrS family protein n=1 Tax=Ideonella sp. A 288 TaxID=1962181 RepID=UPI001185D38C|nr:NnrS family protein [Ideonella sp. A 288]